jgi:hypothetical protein
MSTDHSLGQMFSPIRQDHSYPHNAAYHPISGARQRVQCSGSDIYDTAAKDRACLALGHVTPSFKIGANDDSTQFDHITGRREQKMSAAMARLHNFLASC